MPTVLRVNGYAFMIYTDDHEPMHVHVWFQGREAILTINETVEIRENNGMNRTQLRNAVRIAEENVSVLRTEWVRIHG